MIQIYILCTGSKVNVGAEDKEVMIEEAEG